MERGLAVGFCGQLHHNWPNYPAAWFRSPPARQRGTADSLLNRFRTVQGPCRAILHKWRLADSPTCDCSQQQTMSHIVDVCSLTKFDGALQLLHNYDAVTWLEARQVAGILEWLQHSWNENQSYVQKLLVHNLLFTLCLTATVWPPVMTAVDNSPQELASSVIRGPTGSREWDRSSYVVPTGDSIKYEGKDLQCWGLRYMHWAHIFKKYLELACD